jgi:hypothetical protein
MGNASLLDVFNAAARFGNQALDIYSREKKYELDVKLHEQQMALDLLQKKLMEDYLTIDPNGNNQYQSEPELYQKHIDKELDNWLNNAAKAGNNSKYYNDQLTRLHMAGQVNMGKKLEGAKVLAARQQAAAAYRKEDNIILNDENKTPPEKLQARLANLELGRQNNLFDITNFNEERDRIYTTTLEHALGQNLQATTDDDSKEVKRIAADFPNDMPGKAETVQKAAGTRKAQIWKTNFTLGDADEKKYRNKIASAKNAQQAGEGELETMRHFQALARDSYFKGIQVKNKALGENASEYDPNDRPKIKSWYPWDDILGEQPGAGSGSGSQKPPVVDKRDILIARTKEGNDPLTPYTMYEVATDTAKILWESNHPQYGLTQKERNYYGNDFNRFLTETFTELYSGFFEAANRIINQEAGNPASLNSLQSIVQNIGKLNDDEQRILIANMQDFVYSTHSSQWTAANIEGEAQRIADVIKGTRIDKIFTDRPDAKSTIKDIEKYGEGPGLFGGGGLLGTGLGAVDYITAKKAIQNIPEAVNTGVRGSIEYLSPKIQRAIETIISDETKDFQENYGLSGLIPMFDTDGSERANDVSGQIYYSVTGTDGYVRKIIRDNKVVTQVRHASAQGWKDEWKDVNTDTKNSLYFHETKKEDEKTIRQIQEIATTAMNRPPDQYSLVWDNGSIDSRALVIREMMTKGVNPSVSLYPVSKWNTMTKPERDAAIMDYFRNNEL